MAKGQSQTKERVAGLIGISKVVFYYGFIPTILVLGYMKGSDEGAPPLTVMSLLWQ